jgi:hypothetical protein
MYVEERRVTSFIPDLMCRVSNLKVYWLHDSNGKIYIKRKRSLFILSKF